MTKVNDIIGRTPIIINNSKSYMEVSVDDFNWLINQAKKSYSENFEAMVTNNNYVGVLGWVEESYIEPTNGELFDNIIKKFEGKKVEINIRAIENL